MSGLTTVGKETMQSMSDHAHYSEESHTLSEFLNQHNLNNDRLNRQRLEALQDDNETQWSTDGVVVISDTVTHDEEIRNAEDFYDHADDDYIWNQNFVFTQYADDTTTYPLVFHRYKTNAKTKLELATALVDETRRVGVPAETYLFDTRYCNRALVDHVESYDRYWLSVLESDDTVEYGGDEISMDTLAGRVDTVERIVDDELYYIWTKKLPVSKLGSKKVLIAEKESNDGRGINGDDGDENPIKYIVTNMIDAPAAHLLRTYSTSQRIGDFFTDIEQNQLFKAD
jgi:hypothetical protein